MLIEWPIPAPLPVTGLAAQHPGDSFPENDSRILICENFEGYTEDGSQLVKSGKWDAAHHSQGMSFDKTAGNRVSGTQSLMITALGEDFTWREFGVVKVFGPDEKQDTLHLRYYPKVAENYAVSGPAHNGGGFSGNYNQWGWWKWDVDKGQHIPTPQEKGGAYYRRSTAGVIPQIKDRFLAGLEWDFAGGDFSVYVYHPGQIGEWGDRFFSDRFGYGSSTDAVFNDSPIPLGEHFKPLTVPASAKGKWTCYEIMVKANTVPYNEEVDKFPVRDGRIAVWIDGKLALDYPNLLLRRTLDTKIDDVSFGSQVRSNPGPETYIWYDNIVVANEYIGPHVDSAKVNLPIFH
jgi:hypothetical protein